MGTVAFDCRTGAELWRRRVPSLTDNQFEVVSVDPVVGDMHVWLPGFPVVCRDLGSGDMVWSGEGRSQAQYSLVLLWIYDRLLSENRGVYYALDPLSGDVIDSWTPTELDGNPILQWASVGGVGCTKNGGDRFVVLRSPR